MRLIGVIGTAVLSLTLAAPAYAQQEQHEQEEQKDKPAQENEKKAQPQENEKKAQPEKPAKPEEKSAQEQKNTKPEEKNAQQRTQEAKPAEHAAGGRIPADRYKASFGREHTFRVSQGDYSSGRFQYGGYWFGFGGAWPSNWLYTQDVYVVEIDGMYYLCNPTYPGVNLAISVTL
jgi:hypothetical protein